MKILQDFHKILGSKASKIETERYPTYPYFDTKGFRVAVDTSFPDILIVEPNDFPAREFKTIKEAQNFIFKKFKWEDKSGRGFSSTLTLNDIVNIDDMENWNGDFLHMWAYDAQPGDVFENSANRFTQI